MSVADSITSSKQFDGDTDLRVSLGPLRGVQEKTDNDDDDDDDDDDDYIDADGDDNPPIVGDLLVMVGGYKETLP